MEYRYFGPTGLKVSVLGFGNGGNWYGTDTVEEKEARHTQIIKFAYENGVNYFDTAEVYGAGQGEIGLGKAFKDLNLPREQLVVSTKVFWSGEGPNDLGLSRKHIIEAVNNSLKRLQLDYVDIVFCHRPDLHTPLEETCRAFDYLINQGKAFYWGTSEWSADRIAATYAVCDKLGLHRPVVEQCEYSMVLRDRFEKEYAFLFKEHKMATTIYSPMAGGILSGKYNKGIPEGSRYTHEHPVHTFVWNMYFGEGKKERSLKKLEALAEIAKEIDCTQAQLALAWTLVSKNVSTCLFGATNLSQIENNIKAVEIYKKITPEIGARIEKILENKPTLEYDYTAKAPLNLDR